MASTYHNLGSLAQDRGDYDEATRQYQRALEIFERLGNQASMATTYSQLGILEAEQPDGSAATAVGWHVKALAIRLHMSAPQAANDLRRLAAHRKELGPERFTSLLSQATGNTGLTKAITSLLDQLDAAETSGDRNPRPASPVDSPGRALEPDSPETAG
jgi:tetratricopeptide (TPR) repeat protein